jgi:hypothetical protein
MKADKPETRIRRLRLLVRNIPPFVVTARGTRQCLFCGGEDIPHGNGHETCCQLMRVAKKERIELWR